MKVAVIGAGFTGLSAAYYLSLKGIEVTVFEKEKKTAGLAASFKLPYFKYPLEKHYHHWFSNDKNILQLIEDLKLSGRLIFPKSKTAVYYKDRIFDFNSPKDVLIFKPLPFSDRIRTGFATLALKLTPTGYGLKLEKYQALEFLKKLYGKKAAGILWEPLFEGKFSVFSKDVNMAWFWARIKKRTPTLGYLEGGYALLADRLVKEILKNKGKIYLKSTFDKKNMPHFDRILFTVPSPVFYSYFPKLEKQYRISDHLDALNLIIVSKQKLLPQTYWLNINEKGFPFIGVIQHTNLAPNKWYGMNEIAYVANYLPQNHKYFNLKEADLFRLYLPFLKRINPSFEEKSVLEILAFRGSFGQPIFTRNYSGKIPAMITPVKNVYLANMDMVYPWDRGTNYAVQMGRQAADLLSSKPPIYTNPKLLIANKHLDR